MSQDSIKVSVDKFTFQIPNDLLYSDAGVWVRLEGDRARLGLSDFTQQSSGDVAFANVKPAGTKFEPGDEFADIETVKVNLSFPSPVKGTAIEINTSLADSPEQVNQDSYGQGWLAVVTLADWEGDRGRLLDADAYAVLVKEQAEAEMKK